MTRRSIAPCLLVAAALLRCSSFSSSAGPDPDAAVDASVVTTDVVVVDPPDEGAPVVLPAGCDATCGGTHGPCGVRIEQSCIDATEVTIADWRLFVAARPTSDATPVCPSITPGALGVRQNDGVPITDVSFCEARAYCLWAGKQLCGLVGGGPLTPDQPTSQRSLWYNACTGGSTEPLVRIGDAGCNLATSKAVPARTTCQGGVAGLYDMVGNAAEWVDATEPDGQGFKAYYLGSSFFGAERDTCQVGKTKPVLDHDADIGFRCCSSP